MASIQPHTHSFIVKVWLAVPEGETGRHMWRGRVTHVASGRDCHFLELAELKGFITPYLHQLGVRPTLLWKLTHWVRR
jgi:hypothetical protein